MQRTLLLAAAAGLTILLTPAVQAADGWGIAHEKETTVEAKVVDLLCEVTGNCVDNCGGGKRQLGLLMDDGRLVPVLKNADIFAGATADMIAFCGKTIVADGLFIDNPKMPMFALQNKSAPGGELAGANQWAENWSKRNDGADSSDWYLKDKRVLAEIEKGGVFGIPGLKPAE